MIDTHAHLLPGLDDGCASLEESLECCRLLVEAGYTDACCTPHVWAQHVYHRTGFLREELALLSRAVSEAGIPLRLHGGAELHPSTDVTRVLDDDLPTYGFRFTHVLFDFWDDELPAIYWPWVKSLQMRGLTVIQAHPERIACFQDSPELVDELLREGVLLQGNLQCLADPIGRPTRDLIERWLDEDKYFMLGSDLHRPSGWDIRAMGLERARSICSKQQLNRLTRTNPGKLLGLHFE